MPTVRDLRGERSMPPRTRLCSCVSTVLNGALCGVALLATAVRLGIRYSQRKMWWDDYWIVVCATSTTAAMVLNYVHSGNLGTLSLQLLARP